MGKVTKSSKHLSTFIGALVTVAGMAQSNCIPITSHALGDACLGGAYLQQCNDAITQVVWSTGDVGFGLGGLEPGTYTGICYAESAPVDIVSVLVERVHWEWDGFSSATIGFGTTIYAEASVPYCTTIFNTLCCMPDPAQTYVDLIQDGTTIIASQAGVQCFGALHQFQEVPPGHAYSVRLRDLQCGQTLVTPDTIVVNNCDSLALNLAVSPTVGDAQNGSIEVVQAIAETSGPYPLPAGPVPGAIWLFSGLTGWDEAGESVWEGTHALWTDLDSGWYRVQFRPAAGCNFITDTVHVGHEVSTGVVPLRPSLPELFIGPSVVQDELFVQAARSGTVHVRIFDGAGRMVSRGPVVGGRYGVGALVPGLYVAEAEQGGRTVRQRVLKQ